MSILNVEHLTHGFGDRAIFNDVSFRLLKGEHIGLVGANGEGKSTFMSIVTGKMLPDEGKVEWSKNVHAGYLDQHAVLKIDAPPQGNGKKRGKKHQAQSAQLNETNDDQLTKKRKNLSCITDNKTCDTGSRSRSK